MSFLSNLFKQSPAEEVHTEGFCKVDMHSHLLPGIDDGVKDFDESLEIIENLYKMGYRKLITTPHIMADFYRNTPEEIRALCAELNEILVKKKMEIEVFPAAEYYLDDHFEEQLKKKNLLTFGNNYVLVETSYLNQANNFFEVMFQIKVSGYQPVLAHPERYVFLHNDFEKYKEIFRRDIFFQLNLSSLVGYYSKESKKIAEKLIKDNMVHFIGTDVHHIRHVSSLMEAIKTPGYKQLSSMQIMNNSLL